MSKRTWALMLMLVFMAGTTEVQAGLLGTAKLSLDGGGSNLVIIEDQGLGDSNPLLGAITYIGSVGDIFTVNVTTGISKPVLQPVQIDLNSVNVSSSRSGTLTISFTDVDFVSSGETLVSLIGGTTGGTIESATQELDISNVAFGGGEDSIIIRHNTPFSGAFHEALFASVVIPAGQPFSLTEVVSIHHTGNQISSFDFSSQVVPIPGSVLLLGSGLAGFGVIGRRRRKP